MHLEKQNDLDLEHIDLRELKGNLLFIILW